ncbi:hypothetical protein PF002_g15424 [Phytophthora fragariae]|uniref:Uncharacterized protein n=1 Tax=Phytophthora fragariae TaxID=53985 RepID=A0A6A3YQW2_9STRA|nr:hypothetical protein PF002_g15424 [Phytophthora fragariae]
MSDRLKNSVDRVQRTMDGRHFFDPMYDVVHLDEKWFYKKKFVQSKRHIKKVMFLCAVARPRGDWDGKWRNKHA